jgi:hypothetical protein
MNYARHLKNVLSILLKNKCNYKGTFQINLEGSFDCVPGMALI